MRKKFNTVSVKDGDHIGEHEQSAGDVFESPSGLFVEVPISAKPSNQRMRLLGGPRSGFIGHKSQSLYLASSCES